MSLLRRQYEVLGRASSFRALFFATLASGIGTYLAVIALIVDVYDRTGSGAWVAALLIVEFLPMLFIGLLLGPLVDRLPRAEYPRPDGADRAVHRLGDLLVAEAVDLAQRDVRAGDAENFVAALNAREVADVLWREPFDHDPIAAVQPRDDFDSVAVGAANRDPAHFPDPDRLDLARPDNRHVAFGRGIHFCLGAPLARIEGQIAINTLLKRMPQLALAVEHPEHRQSLTLRGLTALPVSF